MIVAPLEQGLTSHVTRHTSHVTRHTSHVTRHTSHGTHGLTRICRLFLSRVNDMMSKQLLQQKKHLPAFSSIYSSPLPLAPSGTSGILKDGALVGSRSPPPCMSKILSSVLPKIPTKEPWARVTMRALAMSIFACVFCLFLVPEDR